MHVGSSKIFSKVLVIVASMQPSYCPDRVSRFVWREAGDPCTTDETWGNMGREESTNKVIKTE